MCLAAGRPLGASLPRHRPGRPVLRPHRGQGREAVGHLEPHPPPAPRVTHDPPASDVVICARPPPIGVRDAPGSGVRPAMMESVRNPWLATTTVSAILSAILLGALAAVPSAGAQTAPAPPAPAAAATATEIAALTQRRDQLTAISGRPRRSSQRGGCPAGRGARRGGPGGRAPAREPGGAGRDRGGEGAPAEDAPGAHPVALRAGRPPGPAVPRLDRQRPVHARADAQARPPRRGGGGDRPAARRSRRRARPRCAAERPRSSRSVPSTSPTSRRPRPTWRRWWASAAASRPSWPRSTRPSPGPRPTPTATR